MILVVVFFLAFEKGGLSSLVTRCFPNKESNGRCTNSFRLVLEVEGSQFFLSSFLSFPLPYSGYLAVRAVFPRKFREISVGPWSIFDWLLTWNATRASEAKWLRRIFACVGCCAAANKTARQTQGTASIYTHTKKNSNMNLFFFGDRFYPRNYPGIILIPNRRPVFP